MHVNQLLLHLTLHHTVGLIKCQYTFLHEMYNTLALNPAVARPQVLIGTEVIPQKNSFLQANPSDVISNFTNSM